MNTKILYFVGGVVTGSVATFLILKHKMDLEMEKEIDDFKKEYAESNKKVFAKIVEKNEADMGVNFTAKVVDPATIAKLNEQKKRDLITNSNILKRTNYNAFSNPPKEEDLTILGEEDEDEEDPGDYPREDLAEKPYIITSEQFTDENPFFDKVTLEYYKDDILADALSDDIIEDKVKAIGVKALEKIKKYEVEGDALYVRNERTSTDYEVILQPRPFARLDEDDY